MKIVFISDTHEFYPVVPDGDVLVHAGDLTFRGDYKMLARNGEWLRSLPHEHKIVIAGNHDLTFETDKFDALNALGRGIHYLENEELVINDVKFYGSPYTPRFFDWAFMYDRAEGQNMWKDIPVDTDVLITHGPPKGFLDQAIPHKGTDHLGCIDLNDAVFRVKPKIHVFGHIHGGYGCYRVSGMEFLNASVVNEAYKLVNKPWERTIG